MARVEAESFDGKRVVFTARGRSFVNVRETLPDGPIGYSSIELLLIALSNCTMGVLLGHDLLKDVPIKSLKIAMDSQGESNPSRVAKIMATIDLEVDDTTLAERRETLQRVIDNCPVGNTLRFSPEVSLELRIKVAEGAST